MTNTTQRTMKFLRANGYLAEKVESWNPFAGPLKCPVCFSRRGSRKDLFGFGDVVGLRETTGHEDVLIVQSTTDSNVSARVRKIRLIPAALVWLRCGGRIEVWGWSKGENGRWRVRRVDIADLDGQLVVNKPPLRRARGRIKEIFE